MEGCERCEGYERQGGDRTRRIRVAASQQPGLVKHFADLSRANAGKGCIWYTKPEMNHLEAVARLLRKTAASTGNVC